MPLPSTHSFLAIVSSPPPSFLPIGWVGFPSPCWTWAQALPGPWADGLLFATGEGEPGVWAGLLTHWGRPWFSCCSCFGGTGGWG